ncbi:MAG: hypothetical protein GTO02_01955 [Candidatus Dadabacteria bacterium]|nr:hypothetical protein [Candidatus Dadabacteria bacterium]NIQ13201.1 hypothetical protein [Candidatus Dadabacteria bacterium]
MKYIDIIFLCSILFMSTSLFAGEKQYKAFTDIGNLNRSNITIEEVVSSPNKFHKEVIIVDGEISKIEYKTFINGKKFTLFKLMDSQRNNIKVYARGFVDGISEGSKIRIQGRYSKYKKYFFKKYKNVMKAKMIHILSTS